MAPVYKEIHLEWNGKSYKITPTYGLIQQVEQKLSLAHLLSRVVEERAPASQMADLLSMALHAAGCTDADASAEAINADLYSKESHARLAVAATEILLAMLPQQEKDDQGNPTPPETGVGPKTSNGGSTTK